LQIGLRHRETDLRPLGLNLGFQDIRLVGGSDVGELLRDLGRPLRECCEIGLHLDTLLCPQNFVVKGAHGIEDTEPLRLVYCFSLAFLLFKNATASSQFAGRDNSLLDEPTKLSSSNDGSGSVFISRYTNGGVWIETSLDLSACRCSHVSQRLSQGGIAVQSHLFQVFES
jgi:hypothetical protein